MLPIKQYSSYQIQESIPEKQEILVAMLQDFGFDGFEQTEQALIANGYQGTIDEKGVEAYLQTSNIPFAKKIIAEENWNKMWESDFPPIVIEQFCAVRAGFHPPIPNVRHEIIIDPKMSFGTGHHATTWMMMKAMEDIDCTNKTVLDFGTGTGILAILAEKMGADAVEAIDYDDWCIENGKENTATNGCSKITLIKADNLNKATASDIILANINKNIILANFESLKKCLQPNGILLISGILLSDEVDILAAATILNLKFERILERKGWICIQLLHAA